MNSWSQSDLLTEMNFRWVDSVTLGEVAKKGEHGDNGLLLYIARCHGLDESVIFLLVAELKRHQTAGWVWSGAFSILVSTRTGHECSTASDKVWQER